LKKFGTEFRPVLKTNGLFILGQTRTRDTATLLTIERVRVDEISERKNER
jgi:hypothetical protein